MRHFPLTIRQRAAVESAVVVEEVPAMTLPSPDLCLSLEEEMLMVEETTQAAQAVADNLDRAEEVLAVSESMEDIAVVVDNIEEARPTEIALIQTAADMGVAGSTDVTAEELVPLVVAPPREGEVLAANAGTGEVTDLVPATEAFAGRRIATESIRDRAQQVWQSVQEILKKIWNHFDQFVYGIVAQVPRLRRTIADLRASTVDLRGKNFPSNTRFTVSVGLGNLTIDGKTVSSGKDLLDALEVTEEMSQYVFGRVVPAVSAFGHEASREIATMTPENIDDIAGKIVSLADGLNKAGSFPGGSKKEWEFDGYSYSKSQGLLGNCALVHRRASEKTDSVEGTLGLIRKAGISFDEDREMELPKSVEFSALSFKEIEEVLRKLDKILDDIEKYQRGNNGQSLRRARDEMHKASEKASKAVGADDKLTAEGQSKYRAVLDINVGFSRWATDPAGKLMQRMFGIVRTTIGVVNQSMAVYNGSAEKDGNQGGKAVAAAA